MLEEAARALRDGATTTIGIVARDELLAPAAAARRLQLREIALHLGDPRIERPALRGCRAAEKQELLAVAAERAGIGGGAIDLGTLTLRGGGIAAGATVVG